MWMTGTLPLQSKHDLGNILQKASCAHRNVVYTGGMKLFSKKSFPQPYAGAYEHGSYARYGVTYVKSFMRN